MTEWCRSNQLVPYPEALAAMDRRVADIRAGKAAELLWFLEHPPLYSAGTSARTQDLLEPARFPVYTAQRGGEYTYHGPGQRVVYTLLDLETRGRDIRRFVAQLEAWIIATLSEFNLRGEVRKGRVGVWIQRPDKPPLPDGTPREDKIAAIGLRIRKWVSFHGISFNVEPDLSHFEGIVPCGITGHGVTSLVDLGYPVGLDDLDAILLSRFAQTFGSAPIGPVAPPV